MTVLLHLYATDKHYEDCLETTVARIECVLLVN